MTQTQLLEIKSRLAAATPGPWTASQGSDEYNDPTEFYYVTSPTDTVFLDGGLCEQADADLIAHAPDDIAALVAEVERLQGQLEQAVAAERAAILAQLDIEEAGGLCFESSARCLLDRLRLAIKKRGEG